MRIGERLIRDMQHAMQEHGRRLEELRLAVHRNMNDGPAGARRFPGAEGEGMGLQASGVLSLALSFCQ